jgi:hypothetical protein
MGNQCVKDPYVRVLLDRRDEIKKQVNKLQAEYQALGELIRREYARAHSLEMEEGER